MVDRIEKQSARLVTPYRRMVHDTSSRSIKSIIYSLSLSLFLVGIPCHVLAWVLPKQIITTRRGHEKICNYCYLKTTTKTFGSKSDGEDTTSKMSCPDKITGVTLKVAFDDQWAVADLAEDKSERFTCPDSLDMVHRLRRCSDAVLVGRTTVERDDCTLTVRRVPLLSSKATQPTRVILDPNLKLLTSLDDYKIFNDGLPTLIYHDLTKKSSSESTGCDNSGSQQAKISKFPDVSFVALPTSKEVRDDDLYGFSPQDIVKNLAEEHGLHHIMVEGGPATAKSFLQQKMIDRAILVFAPMCFKEPLRSDLSSEAFQSSGLELVGTGTLGVDRVQYWSRPNLPWPKNDVDSTLPWP